MAATFFYFGFGSNMLAKRIRLQNPSAKRAGAGKLENYRLDFNTKTGRWQGSPATIVPHEGESVYGAIWEIGAENLKDLDMQEGVDEGIYKPVMVSVVSISENRSILCRAYHLAIQPETPLNDFEPDSVPLDRQPSLTYLKTLVKGAMETGVPQYYIDWLRSIKHNGNLVHDMEKQLQLNINLNED